MKPPIDVLPLIPLVNEKLISFLKSLSPADWTKQTVARKWKVKDAAAHLLDGNFRKISRYRDGWSPAPAKPFSGYGELVEYLNDLNNDWVVAAKRLSPQLITELLAQTNQQVYRLFTELDLFAPAVHSVAWAGEAQSYNWFHLAREYTEFFLHQQQMRDAVKNDDLLASKLYYPFLHIFMQGLPHAYRDTAADNGTVVKVAVTGYGRGEWFLQREGETWQLSHHGQDAASEVSVDGAVAWKLFSKSVRKEDVRNSIAVKGDERLGEKALEMVSVMA